MYRSPKTMQYLFGPEVNEVPSLYFLDGLDYFADNCGLPHSPYFKSEKDIIEKMSILPLYKKFLTAKHLDYLNNKENKNRNAFKYSLKDFGINYSNRPIEGNHYIKFCEVCMQESKEKHLKREHLIPGNLFCYKHNIILKKALFSRRHLKIDFVNILDDKENISEYELNEKQTAVAHFITDSIHEIIENAEDSSYANVPFVIKMKIKELLESKDSYNDLEEICKALNEISIIQNEILLSQLKEYLTAKNVFSPIFTLHLIYLLFGSLESYKKYTELM